MSLTTMLTHREAVPVEIGETTLYCEEFKSSAVKSFSEEASAAGEGVITNSALKASRLTFIGRVCGEEQPMRAVLELDSLMRSQRSFDIVYRGAFFSSCFIQSYVYEDFGEDYSKVSLTVITNKPVSPV